MQNTTWDRLSKDEKFVRLVYLEYERVKKFNKAYTLIQEIRDELAKLKLSTVEDKVKSLKKKKHNKKDNL